SWDALPTDTSDLRLFVSRSTDRGASFPMMPQQPENTHNPNSDSRGPLLFDPDYANRLFLAFERVHYMNADNTPTATAYSIYGAGGSLGVAKYDNCEKTLVEPCLPLPLSQL